MKTLAIIGGGVAGRSLLLTLSRAPKKYDHIYLFDAPEFFNPCSLNSTAIVASRGVSEGHSELGDRLVEGFGIFKAHIQRDAPLGVEKVSQLTGTKTKIEQMRSRYPEGVMEGDFFIAREEAFMIHPPTYLRWLLDEAMKEMKVEIHQDAVIEVEGQRIRTQNGLELEAQQIVFCGGSSQSLWKKLFPDSKLMKTKIVQGAYFEYQGVDLGASFSKTLDGDNAIYSQEHQTLLIGSTSTESGIGLAPEKELYALEERLRAQVEIPLSKAAIKVGLREKAPKREPYLLQEGPYFSMGGFYKNGFSLSLSYAQKLLTLL
jgi:glycine/D-amino acid oxidase-like deaminating enzyme